MKFCYIAKFFAFLILSYFCFNCTQTNEQSDYDSSKLYKLCKVWGFVKYHTPQGLDFDGELFKLLDNAKESVSDRAFEKHLCDWVKSVNQHNKIAESKPVCECAVRVSFDWTKDSLLLGSDLVKELSITERSVFDTNSYVYFTGGLFQNFSGEKKYEQDTLPNTKLCLLTLFRYWNIIEYYFPYRNTLPHWNETLKEMIPRFLSIKNKTEFLLNLKLIQTQTNDGHAFFVNTTDSEMLDKHFGDRIIPLVIENIQGKYLVIDYFDSLKTLKPIIKKGDEILKIYDIPVDSLIKSMMPYAPGSNMNFRINLTLFYILKTFEKEINITYNRNGQTNTVSIKTVPCNLQFYKASDENKLKSFPEYSFLRNDVGYLFIAGLSDTIMPIVMKKMRNTKAIIIDLRYYPKNREIIRYSKFFVKHDLIFDFFQPHSSYVGCFTLKNNLITIVMKNIMRVNEASVYQGKVYVLVNHGTMSAGEVCTMALQMNPEIKIIGNQTAGVIGSVVKIPLPFGIDVFMTGMKNHYLDGTEAQHAGVKIDYEVYPDIKSIQEGRDVYIEKALELIDAEK